MIFEWVSFFFGGKDFLWVFYCVFEEGLNVICFLIVYFSDDLYMYYVLVIDFVVFVVESIGIEFVEVYFGDFEVIVVVDFGV